jgi:hypothetical protein
VSKSRGKSGLIPLKDIFSDLLCIILILVDSCNGPAKSCILMSNEVECRSICSKGAGCNLFEICTYPDWDDKHRNAPSDTSCQSNRSELVRHITHSLDVTNRYHSTSLKTTKKTRHTHFEPTTSKHLKKQKI